MRSRLLLHDIFMQILGTENAVESRVYFQPPPTVVMKYPCIMYERSSVRTQQADNLHYTSVAQYTVTVVDKNPDSVFAPKVLELPMCSFDRHYTADNMNHDVFTIYF